MTPERTLKIELWRAFYLGLRTALVTRGDRPSNEAVHAVLEKLDAIMRGDETLYDPASDLAGYAGHDQEHINRMQLAMRSDHELAKEIAEGFHYFAEEVQR